MKNSEGFDKLHLPPFPFPFLHLPPFPFPPRGKCSGRSFPRGGRLGRGLLESWGKAGKGVVCKGRLGRGLLESWGKAGKGVVCKGRLGSRLLVINGSFNEPG
jgi:hypothetical protein